MNKPCNLSCFEGLPMNGELPKMKKNRSMNNFMEKVYWKVWIWEIVTLKILLKLTIENIVHGQTNLLMRKPNNTIVSLVQEPFTKFMLIHFSHEILRSFDNDLVNVIFYWLSKYLCAIGHQLFNLSKLGYWHLY